MNPISSINFTAIPNSLDLKEHHAAPISIGEPNSAAVCVV
jgi:hypothetical protein